MSNAAKGDQDVNVELRSSKRFHLDDRMQNAEDEEVACEAGDIAASILGRSDSCKVG